MNDDANAQHSRDHAALAEAREQVIEQAGKLLEYAGYSMHKVDDFSLLMAGVNEKTIQEFREAIPPTRCFANGGHWDSVGVVVRLWIGYCTLRLQLALGLPALIHQMQVRRSPR